MLEQLKNGARRRLLRPARVTRASPACSESLQPAIAKHPTPSTDSAQTEVRRHLLRSSRIFAFGRPASATAYFDDWIWPLRDCRSPRDTTSFQMCQPTERHIIHAGLLLHQTNRLIQIVVAMNPWKQHDANSGRTK